MTQGLTSLVWFVAVLAAIPLLLWLVKRSGFGGALLAPAMLPGVPRTVASLTLSGQQRVVTVEVGSGDARTWLVLGVSPQGIQTLHALPMAALPVIDTASAGATTGPGPHLATAAFGSQPSPVTPVAMPPFAQMLSRVLKHHRHAPR